ncbi:helix-turn-helix domain-containing protein [Paenibacillus crassostreae]|uniref:Helix-turn-helix domain-containing protein n=1 Tax=Paenibacillus crassostreae TaxID=1763538 RepID=A0A167DCJ9_9BACL|nr:helix-turn-helix domain-containing protein [Paenibacillus crassostreae]AOZ94843.1 hypothetical protein LPB68_21470 [Paenibacillus crassostreae]AOZ94869.1 hypothetical protein LPB68_21630 [Paenibacillus crassostreae]OAB74209.1 hypothetical protein PNBC_12845 [Paenibacillus crassostreae]
MSNERIEYIQDDGQLRVFIVPVDIMDVPDLSIYEQMVYMVLRSYVNPTDPTAFPSYPTIAKRGRMSRSSAIRAVEGLVQKGLITKELRLDVSKNRKIKNTSNLYTLIMPKKLKDNKGSVSQTRGVVSHRHGGSVSQTPNHNHLKEPLLNKIDCMNTHKELDSSSESIQNELYESLNKYIPKYFYIEGIPVGLEYIDEIFLMLITQFSDHLDPEIVEIAAKRYFDRTAKIALGTPNGVEMTLEVREPVALFQICYKESIALYKAKYNHATRRP